MIHQLLCGVSAAAITASLGGATGPLVPATVGSITSFNNDVSTATASVPKPADLADGDTLVLLLGMGDGVTVVTPPAGWTELRFANYSRAQMGVYTKEVSSAASEPATYDFGFNSDVRSAGAVYRFTGAGAVSAPAEDGQGSNTTSHPAASVDAVATDTVIFGVSGGWGGAFLYTPPAGETLDFEEQSTGGSADGLTITAIHEVIEADGPTGTRLFTCSDSLHYASISVVVKGASGEPEPPAAGHRYWRLYISATSGSATWVTAGEIEFRATQGGPDLTSPAEATTAAFSSSQSLPNSPDKAFNDVEDPTAASNDSYWSCASGSPVPSWVGWDFGDGNEVAVEEVYFYPARATDRQPEAMVLEYSDDGVTWFPKAYIDDQTGWVLGTPRVFNSTNWSLPEPRVTALNTYVIHRLAGAQVSTLNEYIIFKDQP